MSKDEQSTVTQHDDGRFIRTAIVVTREPEDSGGSASFDLVDELGNRIALINAFAYPDDETGEIKHVIVDVIDTDDNFPKKFALTFDNETRKFHHADTSSLICADFRKEGA